LEEMAKLEARALKSEGARRDERNTQVTTLDNQMTELLIKAGKWV